MARIALILAALLTWPAAAWAQLTPEILDYRVKNKICPANAQEIGFPSFREMGCNDAMDNSTLNRCHNRVEKLYLLIGRYNELVRQCAANKNVRLNPNGARAGSTAPARLGDSVLPPERDLPSHRPRQQEPEAKAHFQTSTGQDSPHDAMMRECKRRPDECPAAYEQMFSSARNIISAEEKKKYIASCYVEVKYVQEYCAAAGVMKRSGKGLDYAALFDIYKNKKRQTDYQDKFLSEVSGREAAKSMLDSQAAQPQPKIAPAQKQGPKAAAKQLSPRQRLANHCRTVLRPRGSTWACCPDSQDRGGADDMSSEDFCLARMGN